MQIKGLVLKSTTSTTKSGSLYQVVSLVNPQNSTPFQVSVWGAKEPYKRLSLFTAEVKDSDGFYSCPFSLVKLSKAPEEYLALVPSPVTQDEWNSVIEALSGLMTKEEGKVFSLAATLLYVPYSKGTAARTNHHNFEGGLLTHTYELLNIFKSIYSALPFKVNPFIVAFSSLYHDFGKLSEYDENFNYKPALFLQGHPFLSAEAAGAFLRKHLTSYSFINDSLLQHVQHCILAHHGRLEFGSPVLPASPEAFLVAKLDELSGIGVQFDKPTGSRINNVTVQRYE